MERLQGFWELTYIDHQTTYVVYQVDADPGGWLPHWLVRYTTKKLPLNTIRNLREQVAKTKGQYEERIAGWLDKFDLREIAKNAGTETASGVTP